MTLPFPSSFQSFELYLGQFWARVSDLERCLVSVLGTALEDCSRSSCAAKVEFCTSYAARQPRETISESNPACVSAGPHVQVCPGPASDPGTVASSANLAGGHGPDRAGSDGVAVLQSKREIGNFRQVCSDSRSQTLLDSAAPT